MKAQKYSYKRERIYKILCETETHPAADWIYTQLKPEIPDLSLGTVYRNLAAFRREGKAVSIGVVAGQERFDARVEPHTHFVCRGCHRVFDLDGMQCEEQQIARLAAAHQIRVDACRVTLFGKCRACLSCEAER